jgi:hypothetical protein
MKDRKDIASNQGLLDRQLWVHAGFEEPESLFWVQQHQVLSACHPA